METQNEIDPQQSFNELLAEIKRRQRWRLIRRCAAAVIGITILLGLMIYFNILSSV